MTAPIPLDDFDRRALLLDEMSDVEIGEMAAAEIPPEHRYSVSVIPD